MGWIYRVDWMGFYGRQVACICGIIYGWHIMDMYLCSICMVDMLGEDGYGKLGWHMRVTYRVGYKDIGTAEW